MGFMDPQGGGAVTAAAIETALGFAPQPLTAPNLNTAFGYTPVDLANLDPVNLDVYPTKVQAGATPVSYNDRLSTPTYTRRSDLNIGSKTVVGLNSLYTCHFLRVPDSVRAAYPAGGKYRVYTSTDHDSTDGGVAIGKTDNDDPLVASSWTWLRNSGSAKMFFDGTNNQTETPNVVWNPATALFHLYYQRKVSGTTQGTYLATSANGVTGWTVVGQVLKNLSNGKQGWNHTGYAKVFYIDGQWIAWHLAGSGSTVVDGYTFSYSRNGIDWIQDELRVASAVQMTDGSLQFGISALFQWRGQIWAIGNAVNQVSGSTSSTSRRTWMAPINRANDFRTLFGSPQYIEPGALIGAETSVPTAPPAFATLDDGRLVGATLVNGENGYVSLAVLA